MKISLNIADLLLNISESLKAYNVDPIIEFELGNFCDFAGESYDFYLLEALDRSIVREHISKSDAAEEYIRDRIESDDANEDINYAKCLIHECLSQYGKEAVLAAIQKEGK